MDPSSQSEIQLYPSIHEYTESLSLTAEQQLQLAEALRLQRDQIYTQPPELQQQRQQQQRRRSPGRSRFQKSSSAYSAWARAQATGSAYFLVGGGILCLFFRNWMSGAYSILLGILVYFVEQRPHHPNTNKSVSGLSAPTIPPTSFTPSAVLRAPSVRSSFYIIAAVPCFLCAPNYSGGMCLVSSGLTYSVAATIDWRKRRLMQKSKRSSEDGKR
ncbi:hypothetical protein EDD21DRAFT_5987 [Dissophora ornata]|nr:hypothetical protein EDD21DRAFT_5987 [Dissophora ornata]